MAVDHRPLTPTICQVPLEKPGTDRHCGKNATFLPPRPPLVGRKPDVGTNKQAVSGPS